MSFTPLAAPGGITYGQSKTTIARVVDNGLCDTDPRVLERVNEATKLLLDAIVPVGGMATYDVVADGTTLLLPPELENAIEVEVQNEGLIFGQADVRQGWYNIVNNFTYVDPSMQNDYPLVDLYLHPDPADPNVLRRKYDFPGLTQGATVRVTGAKRYIPIASDDDYLIIQNIRALKQGVMALERWDINDKPNGDAYFDSAVDILSKEVKKHLLDPRNSLKRRANWERDLARYPTNSFGWMRARLALDHTAFGAMGKSDVTAITELAEMRLIGKGMWKNCLEVFNATVVSGRVEFPMRVESLLMARLDGMPADLRSIFFGYQKNGPGWLEGCITVCRAVLNDEGEVTDATTGEVRRAYSLRGACTNGSCLSVVAKLRWVKKEVADQMVIRNVEAMRLMVQCIMNEREEKWQQAAADQAVSLNELEKELREYLGGQQAVPHIDMEPIQGEVL